MLYRYVPAHVGNPFALARRMIRSRDRAALLTLLITALGILCIPLDLLLSRRERRFVDAAAAAPARPTIFVCGPARSGTTLVFQVLCRHLDVSYPQNFTALFPHAPIVATRAYRRLFGRGQTGPEDYRNYYGKTGRIAGPSEANHLWNRWVQPDGTGFRTLLTDAGAREAARYFAAFAEIDRKAVIYKNNNLNVFADTVAAAMPNALVICLRRSPDFLAQSLLQARRDIQGSVSRGYGVRVADNGWEAADPIASVCAQVAYLDHRALELASQLGPERFWLVDYEDFCREPGSLIAAVSERLGIPLQAGTSGSEITPIRSRNVVRDPAEMERIRRALG